MLQGLQRLRATRANFVDVAIFDSPLGAQAQWVTLLQIDKVVSVAALHVQGLPRPRLVAVPLPAADPTTCTPTGWHYRSGIWVLRIWCRCRRASLLFPEYRAATETHFGRQLPKEIALLSGRKRRTRNA